MRDIRNISGHINTQHTNTCISTLEYNQLFFYRRHLFYFYLFINFSWPRRATCRSLVPGRDGPVPPAVEAQSLNHWTAREFPTINSFGVFLMWTILKVFIEFVTILLLFYVLVFGPEACGILAPRPGIEPAPPALEGEVPTTGPPGKSLRSTLNKRISRDLSGCPVVKTLSSQMQGAWV